MESCRDFIKWLGADLSMKILMCSDDPSDLVRASSVSRSWRQFVIANGLAKQLCLKIFPELSSVAHVVEVENIIEPVNAEPENYIESECLERDHRVYAFLARWFPSFRWKDCISVAISALPRMDLYPNERVQNTLEPRDMVEQRASYWSSEGESDSSVLGTLVYELVSELCIITEIHVRPYPVYFPRYSLKAMQFRVGRRRFPVEIESHAREESSIGYESTGDDFIWAYTSPEFPMAQGNHRQKFKLPEPVLCIGGILQIQLLGRVQIMDIYDVYRTCASQVHAVGPQSPHGLTLR